VVRQKAAGDFGYNSPEVIHIKKFAFTLLALTLAASTAAAGFFDNAEVNRLIDENYARVQEDGWAELRIPQFLHHISSALSRR